MRKLIAVLTSRPSDNKDFVVALIAYVCGMLMMLTIV